MRKLYIVPEMKYHMTGTRITILDAGVNKGSGGTDWQSLYGKERDGGDMNYVSSSDEGASTGGFGSDAGPWESLW